MKRKRLPKSKTTSHCDNNDDARVAGNNNNDQVKNVTEINNYPTGLREMIVSIIKEMSKEAGGLANLSTSLADKPLSNGQPTTGVKENGRRQLHNLEYKKQRELSDALTVIKKTMKLDAADPFNRPVALDIPDYFDVVDTPMDFGTICNNLEKGLKYMNLADVFKDVQYIWYNCMKYNKKGDYILDLMHRVKTYFIKYWTAAGLHPEQSTSITETCLHNEEHSRSPVTPVAESSFLRLDKPEKSHLLAPLAEIYPMPINMQAGQLLQCSSQSQSFLQQDEANTSTPCSTSVQKKRQGRGPTRCLKLLNAVGLIKVVTNDLGQPIGREASLLTSFLGLTARDGNLAPLIYSSWSKVPEENKENMWKKVLASVQTF